MLTNMKHFKYSFRTAWPRNQDYCVDEAAAAYLPLSEPTRKTYCHVKRQSDSVSCGSVSKVKPWDITGFVSYFDPFNSSLLHRLHQRSCKPLRRISESAVHINYVVWLWKCTFKSCASKSECRSSPYEGQIHTHWLWTVIVGDQICRRSN